MGVWVFGSRFQGLGFRAQGVLWFRASGSGIGAGFVALRSGNLESRA